ncbi:MAG: hypothetical protein ACKO7B_05715 [Flavobacteriales bacterium]
MKKICYLFLALLSLASCSEGIKKSYTIDGIELTAEGPLFDGPNTLQATHTIDLNKIENGLKAEQIESVKLMKASVSTNDSSAFNSVRNFVLQFTSSDAKMQKAGVLNPVPKNTPTVDLTPSAEAEMTDNFKQKEIILILDADLEGDRDDNLTYTGDFEFEITYKK